VVVVGAVSVPVVAGEESVPVWAGGVVPLPEVEVDC